MENMKGNRIAAKQLVNPFTPLLLKYYDPFHGLGTIGEGNWGYSKEDAVVINANDDSKGVQMEFIFAEERSRMECIHCYDNACYGRIQRVSQELIHYGEKSFDVVTVKVNLLSHDNNKPITKFYITQFWFDITNSYWGPSESNSL